ncbi:MAG: hypothetical protein JJ899_14810, partial [Alphaproteobacteria bacterium]|nr:hypothetical protein [Alphaproteobacteria bacterium]
MRLLSNGNRPYHWGPFPLEVLARDDAVAVTEVGRPRRGADVPRAAGPQFGQSLRYYRDIFARAADGDVAPERAPGTDDPDRCAIDIKGASYFLDAAQVGICEIPETAWREGATPLPHTHAIVLLIEHPRVPSDEPLSAAWTGDHVVETAEMRGTEIAANIAGHIRLMGYGARADLPGERRL